jgi:7-cyano-7-deazaguanine synthase
MKKQSAAVKKKAICIISGGMDSITAAAMVKAEGYDIYTLHFVYGATPGKRETECAKKLSKWISAAAEKIIELDFYKGFGGSALLEDNEYLTQENNDREYVPFRNTIFLSIATAWAEAISADLIVIGSNANDIYCPDNTNEYINAVQKVVRLGAKNKNINIRAPLREKNLGKADVVKIGMKLGVPFEHTWACFNRTDVACGECNNCINRYLAFRKAGFIDPLKYKKIPQIDLNKEVIV